MQRYIFIVFSLIISQSMYAQRYGTVIKPIQSVDLSPVLSETSGLIYWEHSLWTHNDSRDINLYRLDTLNGNILDSIALNGIVNTDIEEISQDEHYLYLLDAGNNNSGIRTDLHILRIEKESFLLRQPLIDTIWFSYEDQYDLETQSANATDFDCEAFIVTEDSIYLFSKQWLRQGTKMYVLPKQAGRHKALVRDSLSKIGMLTGVVYLPAYNQLFFCGYNRNLHPFMLLFHSFEGHNFFSGSSLKIKLNLPFHQIEAISSNDGKKFYLTNETFNRAGINVLTKLHVVDLSGLLIEIE